MHQPNQNRRNPRPAAPARRGRRGQAILESAFSLLLFLVTLISIMDLGQLLFTHQMMTERVRAAVRWGIVNAWDGTGDQIANVVLYNQPTDPGGGAPTFMGMSRSNVSVVRTPPTAENPNDERITVSIANYQFILLSPWIGHSFTPAQGFVESASMFYKP